MRIALKLVFLLNLIFAFGQSAMAAAPYLMILHFDVGQGDSTLIRGTNGKTLLIDTGRKGNHHKLKKELKAIGVHQLDALIISHFDIDHYGAVVGLGDLIGRGTRVYDRSSLPPPAKARQQSFKDYQHHILHNQKANRQSIVLGTNPDIDLGKGVVVRVLVANGMLADGRQFDAKDDENAASIGLHIRYGDFDYWTSGDLTGGGRGTPNLEAAVAPLIGDVDVLRVNHHGSHTSSSVALLTTLKPEVAILSVGAGGYAKRYKHPRQTVVENLVGKNLGGYPSAKALFMTNGGYPDKPLSTQAQQRVIVAHGNIAIWVSENHYIVNGRVFETDG